MIKILFVCHGNICRSVMAEYMFKDYLKKNKLQDKIFCSSKAVSLEEIGNDIYYMAKKCLDAHSIKYQRHYASLITKQDYQEYDYIYLMDKSNKHLLSRIVEDVEHKVFMLLDYDVADPWYSRDFEKTYNDITKGIERIVNELKY